MPPPLSWALQALLALVFAWASGTKLVRWPAWRSSLAGYGLTPAPASAAAVLVPLLEATVAVLVVAGATRIAMAGILTLLSGFSFAILRARVHSGDRLPCGCFGRTEERDYRLMLGRNAGLAALAGAVLVFGEDGDLVSGAGAPRIEDVLPGLLVVVGALLVVWMARHASSLFHRRENT